jgi:rhamnosyltransferase
MSSVTVAIPVRNGGEQLRGVLRALAVQTVGHELLVCDSGSSDGSAQAVREHGGRVVEIEPSRFGHGSTRNLLLAEAGGERVALLTQDAEPADERWLERLLGAFELADGVALAYGPYLARPQASAAVRIELERWFGSLAPDGRPRVDRLSEAERGLGGAPALPVLELLGARGFFTDANACISREAWQRVPFREVPYAEDRALALDMLRAGYAKAYVPEAAVLHSHGYAGLDELRRCFDEWRGLREVYGWREPASPAHVIRRLRGELAAAGRDPIVAQGSRRRRYATILAVTRHNVLRLSGALLGSRADLLPSAARRGLSLEGRASFLPLEVDVAGTVRTEQDPES